MLRPISERPGSSSSRNRTSGSSSDIIVPPNIDPEKRSINLGALTESLPDILNNILNLYSRAWTFTDEKVPPISYSHSAIRFTKLLAIIRKDNGFLTEAALGSIVLNRKFSASQEHKGIRSTHSTMELCNMLMRAYPLPLTDDILTADDRVTILSSIASVLAELGYSRKKALILKEIMTCVLPKLVEARKTGAAEMGVHPAASLASLSASLESTRSGSFNFASAESEQTISRFLDYVCETFHIDVQYSHSPNLDTKSALTVRNDHASIRKAMYQAATKQVGSLELKTDVLRTCINICEALPSLAGALQYSADLLRTTGSGIAPSPESSNGSPSLQIEEQIRLANNISRTVDAAQHIGVQHSEARYWDEFLVRGVELLDPAPTQVLTVHRKSELKTVKTNEARNKKNPFIYNPFLKQTSEPAGLPVLVAHEERTFRVTLQNLYDIDLYIETIQLLADDQNVLTLPSAANIGPYRTQSLLLSLCPKEVGPLAIIGCYIKVRGCKPRAFAIFDQPWEFKADAKGQKIQSMSSLSMGSEVLQESRTKDAWGSEDWPQARIISLEVIGSQPTAQIVSISLPQSTLMLLEGEKQKFTIAIRNSSPQTSADFMLLSFSDSSTALIQTALANKNLSQADMYELQVGPAGQPSFQWVRDRNSACDEEAKFQLRPKDSSTLDIEVFAKPDLTFGAIHVNFGHIGTPQADINDYFYTRQISIPIAITVNKSLELVASDIISVPVNSHTRLVHPDIDPLPEDDEITATSIEQQGLKIERAVESGLHVKPVLPYVLLLLDLHNSWSHSLLLHLSIKNLQSIPQAMASEATAVKMNGNNAKASYIIGSGVTVRIPLPFPKVYLPYSQTGAPIPVLDPTLTRQFIFTSTNKDPTEEMSLRRRFWYREEVLKHLDAFWEEEGTGRKGSVDMRALRFTDQMVMTLQLPDVEIRTTIALASPSPSPSDYPYILQSDNMQDLEAAVKVTQFGTEAYTVPLMTFLTLRTSLHNRSSDPIRGIFRLQPSLDGQTQGSALDLGKKLLVNGLLQQRTPLLKPGATTEIETGFTVLHRGTYAFNSCMEEISNCSAAASERVDASKPKTNSGEVEFRHGSERRSWHNSDACIIIAK